MSRETPEQKRELTDQEWAKMARLAARYKKMCVDEMATGDSRSMRHILNNVSLSLDSALFTDDMRVVFQNQETVQWVQRSVREIKRYFKLLDRYPEFKAGEKARKLGYFADKGIKVGVSIDAYEAKLKDIFPSRKRKDT